MLYNTILRTLLLVFILIQNSTLYSQSINYKSNYYSIKDGLPSREIFDALQDSRGFIWLSSYKHLTRFDGYTFTDFSKLINPGQAKDIIQLNGEQTTLETVSPNHFLIKYATENPIFELINTNNIGIKRYNLSDFFKGKKIIDFIACPGIESIAVFCLEKNELEVFRFNPEANRIEEKLSFPIGLQDNSRLFNVQITCNKKNGNVYFSAASIPVILFDLLQDTAYTLPVRISNIGYKKMKPLKENELALIDSEQNKLLIYNPITQKTAIIHHPLLSHAMDGIWTDLDGNIILASIVNLIHKKLCLIEYETYKIISLDFLLKTEDLISQFGGDHFKDKLLLSTYSGFHTLINEKKRFKSLLTSDLKFGNFGHIMRNMIEDDKGGLYINEEKNHLFKLNMKSDTIEKIFKISPYPEVALNGSMKKIGNNLWGICAKTTRKDQLYSFDLSSNKFNYWALPTDAFAIKAMALGDSTQLICFGRDHITDSTMVFKFNTENGKWQYLNLGPDTPKGKYQYALKDKHRQIWLGTLKGLFLLHADLKTVEKVDFGPAENPQLDISVQSLVIHPESNHLYIGTEYGVWIYDPSQKKYMDHITKESIGLCNDDVQAMIFKNNDELFVTTVNGLSLVNLKSKQARNYYENDGLANNEFNIFSAHKGSNGHYYFGGVNGVTIVTDSSLNEYDAKRPAISRFYKFDANSGNEISFSDNIEKLNNVVIEPEVQYFGFDLMYPDYAEPRLNQFQTWLEGYENDWQVPVTNNKIRYGRLPKGNYTFHIRSFPNMSSELKFELEIKEHFYRSPWFGFGIAIVLIGGGLGLFVKNQQRKRNEELEIQRTNQKFKDLETAALRAQMNPHFIFNCLGSIQHFINEHDTESASRYLANFARLVRLALHSSVDGKHSLQDEIEMLDNYLGLERLRFGEKFSYELLVDPALDKEEIYLPPLLIQPFVENALLHGMKNKTEGGKIKVSFNHHLNGVEASVTDNGPGITAEKRSMDSSGHKSIGMTLTKKRLEILSNNEAFKVSPILDKEGVVTGTMVNIVIPIS